MGTAFQASLIVDSLFCDSILVEASKAIALVRNIKNKTWIGYEDDLGFGNFYSKWNIQKKKKFGTKG